MYIMTQHGIKHKAKLSKQGTVEIWARFSDGDPVGTFQVLNYRYN